MPAPARPLLLATLLACASTATAQPPAPPPTSPSQSLEQRITATAGKPPAPSIDDAAFLRRVRLDLTGRIPSADEVRAFLADPSPDRRARLVDRLLESPEFHQHWGFVLASWLVGERPLNRETYDGRALQAHLASALAARTPYPQIVRELLTAAGSSQDSGPVHFLLRYDADPVKLAGGIGKALMGSTIQCAQCHDHPFAPWQQDDFWGLAATFGRLRRLESDEGDGPALRAIHEARQGELARPNPLYKPPANPNPAPPNPQTDPNASPATDQPEIPAEITASLRLPDGTPIPNPAARRQALADWLTSAQNPFLARNFANRIWAELMGQPLVLRLDDPASPASTTPVLDRLAQDLAASNYDLPATLRALLLSPTYAQKSQANDRPIWARRSARPIPTDALLASISLATGHVPDFNDEAEAESDEGENDSEMNAENTEDNPGAEPDADRLDQPEENPGDDPDDQPGPDADTNSPAISAPGPLAQTPRSAMPAPAMPGRMNAMPGPSAPTMPAAAPFPSASDLPLPSVDTTDHPAELLGLRERSLTRSLILMNGAFLHEAAQSAARITIARHGPAIGRPHLEEAVLATLGRLPTPRELHTLQALIRNAPRRGLEDAYWALLNSAEFQTNH